MSIIVIKKREDIKDCDLAIVDSEDIELLREAKKHSKLVVFLGEKVEETDIFSRIPTLLLDYEIVISVLEKNPHPIIIHDGNEILYSNLRAKEYFGSGISKIEKLLDLLHPNYRDRALERILRALKGEKVEATEELFLMPDGRKLWFESNTTALNLRGKQAILLTLRDITEKVKLEKKLKESEERYRKIFENSPNLIALVDENGVFIEANQAMIRSIGSNPIGKSHYELFDMKTAERRINNMKKAIMENKIIAFQDEREGRFFFNQYIPIELEGKKHCLIIAQEITELLRINNLLRSTALMGETLAIVRDREKLIESVEKILSDYSAKISEKPEGICFPITYGDKNYGYLCVKYAGEEEKKLLKTLAEDLALAFKSIEDEKRKQELYDRLCENIQTIAYLVDGIRNPLAVILAYVEMLIEDEKAKEKLFQQVDRIVRIMRRLDTSWINSEELTRKIAAQPKFSKLEENNLEKYLFSHY